jgi:hypothetical protein
MQPFGQWQGPLHHSRRHPLPDATARLTPKLGPKLGPILSPKIGTKVGTKVGTIIGTIICEAWRALFVLLKDKANFQNVPHLAPAIDTEVDHIEVACGDPKTPSPQAVAKPRVSEQRFARLPPPQFDIG